MKWLIALVGLVATAFGLWFAVDPASSPAADFPPVNVHLIHDLGAPFLAYGLALLAAAFVVPSWRTPLLSFGAVWNAFHVVSHVVDFDRADTHGASVTALVETVAFSLVLGLLAWRSARSSQ